MSGDRGSVTVWMLALALVMLAVGGLVLDLWRVLDAKHRVELLADRSAAAGAAMLDEDRYRSDGVVVLDEDIVIFFCGSEELLVFLDALRSDL